MIETAKVNIGGTSWIVTIDTDDMRSVEFGSYVDYSKNQIIVPKYQESSIIHAIVNVVKLENAFKSGNLDPYETALSVIGEVREKLGKSPQKANVKVATAYRCPNCSRVLSVNVKRPGIRICLNCGQLLNWDEPD